MTAKLAPSLVECRRWTYATWTNHKANHDGWIGDEAHIRNWEQNGIWSDHLVNSRGLVDAVDDDENGIHMPTRIVGAAMHPSTSYLIYEGRIFKARNLFVPEKYRGENPHAGHLHHSIWQTVKAEQSKTPWYVSKNWPTLHEGVTGRPVSEAQMFLNVYGERLAVDGHFGAKTDAAVREYQERFQVAGGADGVVGVHTEYSFRTNGAYHLM